MRTEIPDGDGPTPERLRSRPAWLVGAAMIGVPLAFVGLVAIAPRLPKLPPGTPDPVFAVPFGPGGAKVVWRKPSNGGSAITAYRVTPYLGYVAQPAQVFPPTATNAIFTGLRNGKRYEFVVAARNATGLGDPSRNTPPIIVGTPAQPAAPAVTRAAPGSFAVRVAVPVGNGAPVSRVTVTCLSANGGVARIASGFTNPIIVSGATSGKMYTCTVSARNSRGMGPVSPASEALKG